jgi:hypothetical protein
MLHAEDVDPGSNQFFDSRNTFQHGDALATELILEDVVEERSI